MTDLLLELFSEEIPARMQGMAEEHLANALSTKLHDQGYNIDGGQIETFVTPRRLTIRIKALPIAQADVTVERKGPKLDAPQAALDGFLRSTGLTLNQLEKRGEGKDACYFATIHQKGKPTRSVLKPLIEEILTQFPWPKSMRWGGHDITWVRPLHSILCIYRDEVVPVQFGPVTAGNITYGHRFLAPQAITITDSAEYESALQKAYVIARAETRRTEIEKQANALAAKHGYTVKPDAGLLAEVTGLVEWPVALMGSIDTHFMELPPEVLTTVMRSHQKYFALQDTGGKLAPHFLVVANRFTADDGKAVIAGNERVLRARFSDGRFFWDQDRKRKLEDWAKGLSAVTFHAKLGTIAEKAERIKTLAQLISNRISGAGQSLVEQAALLCKADLVTGMVGEFAELQGIMGRYYALDQGEDSAVADAIRDHYKPLGPSDAVPTTPISICVALADKLDTLISMFAIGEKPTGSKDPYALRRAALGVIRIILENGIRLPLRALLSSSSGSPKARTGDPGKGKMDPRTSLRAAEDDVLDFFRDRLKVQLKDQGIRHDVIDAVMASGDDDLVRVVARAKALQEFLATPDGANLLAAYKRASNILKIEEKKDGKAYMPPAELKLFVMPEEKTLASALLKTTEQVKELIAKEDFGGAMRAMADLRAPVDIFFDKVLVNDKDAAVRENRLKLLASIRQTMDGVADFAVVEG